MRNWFAIPVLALVLALPLISGWASAQDVTGVDRRVASKVIPQYPSLARAMRIQGTVRADVLVEPNGKVKSVEVKGGHPLLAQSAEGALRQWKWEPAPHETHEIVELKFTP